MSLADIKHIAGYIMADLGRIAFFITGAVVMIFGMTASIKGALVLLRMLTKSGFRLPRTIKRLLFFRYAYMKDDTIIYESESTRQIISVSELSAINYHYHAVVGFVAVWEFIDGNWNAVTVGDETPGMRKVWAALEKRLTGFSLSRVQEEVKRGDVEDVILTWESVK